MARLDADSRRQQLVDAAVKVIAEYGVSGATTRRIAAAADAPLASLHYAFHTKDDLFNAVFEALWYTPQDVEFENTGDTTGRRATAIFYKSIEWLISHPELARAQAELFYWGLRNNPEMSSRSYSLTIEHSKRTFKKILGHSAEDSLLDDIARMDVWLTDGLLTSWFSHNNAEQLRNEALIAGRMLETAINAITER
ncbi:TetR family transcriptional regulator [Pseudomonas monteilii]|uniref:TetR family transcriptional regulator n=1 Tax=Pseudomonas monteilii TaxID=76759 RepID=A0A399M8Y1_9PSED|nr:TetR family transcriptional regulator [Pseudomonas monteilii]RII78252.1 TetR family transcriptional regulator [Pseudomonas monteilii]